MSTGQTHAGETLTAAVAEADSRVMPHEAGRTSECPIASIWAQDSTGLLGSGTGMLWRVPADFAHFKTSTMGCPIIMGRASWESLGRALPGRLNIVITRDAGYEALGALVVASIDEAVAAAREYACEKGSSAVWVTGGGQVYRQTMDMVDELVVTDLDCVIPVAEGAPRVDAPEIDPNVWVADPQRSDSQWRERSGDARWKVTTYVRR